MPETPDAPRPALATFAVALGFTPAIYALGPAMLAQVSPANRRGALLALDNSIASLAGVLAPAISGRLIELYPGAHGFELGFLLTGLLLIAGGIVGWIVVDPERSVGRLNAPEPAAQRVQEATP